MTNKQEVNKSNEAYNYKLKSNDPFIIFRDREFYCAFGSLVKLTDGNFLIAFRVAHDDRYLQDSTPEEARQLHIHPRSQIFLLRLSADRRPIGTPILFPPDLAAADQDPNIAVMPNGHVIMSSFSWKPIPERMTAMMHKLEAGFGHEPTSGGAALLWGTYTSLSIDGGITWSPRQYLPVLPHYPEVLPGYRKRYGGSTRGNLCLTKSGICLLPTYDRRSPHSLTFESHVYSSHDYGETWKYLSIIASDPVFGFCETTLNQLSDGRIIAYHRTTNCQGRLAISWSNDDGNTWTKPEITNLVGGPFVSFFEKNNSWLFYGVRSRSPISIRGCPVDVNGRPLIGEEVIIREGSTVRDIGYPSVARISESEVLLSYYWVDSDGVRYISGQQITIEEN